MPPGAASFPCVEMSFSVVRNLRAYVLIVAAAVCRGQDTAAAHLGRGYELIQQQRYDQAATEFRRALEIEPNLPRARYQLAIALFASGERDESARQFDVVRREAPDNRGAVYFLGRLRLLEGDNDGAIRFFQKIAADPPIPDTGFYLGCALLGSGDTQGAITALQRAAADSPRDYRIPYRLARAYAIAGRPNDVTRAYEKAGALRGEYNKAAAEALQCAAAVSSGGDQTACRGLFDPNDPDKLTTLGMIYGQHGAHEKAIQALELASRLDPDSFEIFHNISRNSLSRRPVFKSNARAACICGVRNFCASSSIRAFSSALYGRPGEAGNGSFRSQPLANGYPIFH
jgi:tetratricopeptide (TPR) repeat protein